MRSENHTAAASKPDDRPPLEPKRGAPWEKESIAQFIRAMAREREAMNSYATLSQQGNYSPVNIEIDVGVPMTEARDAAGLARTEVLARLHPDLPRVWRQTFMKLVGMNAISTMAGQPPYFDETFRQQFLDLDHEWSLWWDSHRRDLAIPDDTPLWDAEKKDFVIPTSVQ